MTVSYIIRLVAVAFRTGAMYNAFVEIPDKAVPDAFRTILDAGCDTAPAKYPMAIDVDPCSVDPAPVPKETAFIPP